MTKEMIQTKEREESCSNYYNEHDDANIFNTQKEKEDSCIANHRRPITQLVY
jgi:hypothetical protein